MKIIKGLNCCLDSEMSIKKMRELFDEFEIDECYTDNDGATHLIQDLSDDDEQPASEKRFYCLFGHLKNGGTQDLHDGTKDEVFKLRDHLSQFIQQ